MRIVINPRHHGHTGGVEFARGRVIPTNESPERADVILAAVQSAAVGPVSEAHDFGEVPILAVHEAGLLTFLKSAWAEWQAAGFEGSALPFTFRLASLGESTEPQSIHGKLGRWGFDACTPIVAGTWEAAYWSAQTALTAAALIQSPKQPDGDSLTFALCRPPGHHAGRGVYGGSCYLNNAAIAAEALRHAGHKRVAILDVDYHHGNGTQEIFWERADVLFVSIHADPAGAYPYVTGAARETGGGAGQGANLNIPLPLGTDWAAYAPALDRALAAISHSGATALVLSLGVDTWGGDPISGFLLQTADYRPMGQKIAALGLPTLVVMEGGYALSAIGDAVVNTLTGLADSRS